MKKVWKVYYLQRKFSEASKQEARFRGLYCDWGEARRSFPCRQGFTWFEFSAWKEHMTILISFFRCRTQRERWDFKKSAAFKHQKTEWKPKRKSGSYLYLTSGWSLGDKMVPEDCLHRDGNRKKKKKSPGQSYPWIWALRTFCIRQSLP